MLGDLKNSIARELVKSLEHVKRSTGDTIALGAVGLNEKGLTPRGSVSPHPPGTPKLEGKLPTLNPGVIWRSLMEANIL